MLKPFYSLQGKIIMTKQVDIGKGYIERHYKDSKNDTAIVVMKDLRGKDWRSEEWKEWAKKSRFPFNEPWEKAADMAHDGYTYKEAIKYINKSFPGMTMRDTVKAKKEFG